MRLLLSLPFLLVLVLFALSNEHDVPLRLWPTDYELDVPLSAAILVAMAVAFVVGAVATWIGALGQRRRARRAERTVRRLEEEIAGLRARVGSPGAAGSAGALPPPA